MNSFDTLFMSDFIVLDRRTLNTLCLFYDKLFLHDYFGVYAAIYDSESYALIDRDDPEMVAVSWDYARQLNPETVALLRPVHRNALDSLVLKGVAQAFGFKTGRFGPTFLIRYAAQYAAFVRATAPLMHGGALAMCHTGKNPWSPVQGMRGVNLDLGCVETESQRSFEIAKENNRRACLFEQEYHRLPLISDSSSDPLPWDRSENLLSAALAMCAIPAQVPTVGDVPPGLVLEARSTLEKELTAFRRTLVETAWELGQAARSSARDNVISLATLYYESRIEPVVADLAQQLRGEQTKLRRTFLERALDNSVLVAKALDPTEPYSKWELLASSTKSLLDVQESRDSKAKITSPFEYLIKLPEVMGRRGEETAA